MAKKLSLREIISREIDVRWNKFVALGDEAKKLDKDTDRKQLDKIYLKMKALVIDMQPVEYIVLEQNPSIRDLWHSLKDFQP